MPSPSYPQNFFRYFLLALLAVCLGGATLFGGLGAGRTAMLHFFQGSDSAPALSGGVSTPQFGPPPHIFP
ncbi:MAG: hypothetical protein FWC16_14345, partial [Defluviitaleaceae bacterium]|nr:hypothetical protein [Defluviitaleaceae bacterium]